MNADRYLEEKAIAAQPAKRASPYAKARAARPQAGDPVPNPSIALGETQPEFPEEMAHLPPLAADPRISAPMAYPGMAAPGMEDSRKLGYGDSRGSELEKNVYQSPEEFMRHQSEVMGSPAIEGLMRGANAEQDLAKNFLENYPKGQADMSSLMGLADFLAKGHGHALESYKKPASYEEITGTVSGLLGKAQAARQQATQLGMDQAGPLKSGQSGINDKQQISQEREQGYKIPHPPLMNPFQVVQGVGHSYAENPEVKSANDAVKASNDTIQAVQNPNWLTDQNLRGAIIRGMDVQRVTQNELTMFGGGSPDLLNRAKNTLSRLTTGQNLSPSDRHTIEEWANVRMRTALQKQSQVHQAFQNTYGGFLPSGQIDNITHQGDVQPLAPPKAPGDSERAAQDFAGKFMDLMKQGGPK